MEFEPNSHRFVKICDNLAKMRCLSQTSQILGQTPHILVKFHRFFVDDLGGGWCYGEEDDHFKEEKCGQSKSTKQIFRWNSGGRMRVGWWRGG